MSWLTSPGQIGEHAADRKGGSGTVRVRDSGPYTATAGVPVRLANSHMRMTPIWAIPESAYGVQCHAKHEAGCYHEDNRH